MRSLYVLVCLLLYLPAGLFAADFYVRGLGDGRAMVELEGEIRFLRIGDRVNGAELLSANTEEAIFLVDGRQVRLGPTASFGGFEDAPARTQEVSILRNVHGQYIADATVGGVALKFLVDTGANTVAINRKHARKLGLDYASGGRVRVSTASGLVEAREVILKEISIGPLKEYNVPAIVVEEDFPEIALLGMSFLQRVKMKNEGVVLKITKY